VYDEAQHLQAEHVAASGPAKLANPNSQTWYAGSGGLATSKMAWALRRAAILGTGGRLAYTEATGEFGRSSTAGSRRYRRTHRSRRLVSGDAGPRPVGDRRVDAGAYDELGPDLFARECLCVWDPEPVEQVVVGGYQSVGGGDVGVAGVEHVEA
jgi:hypothetical protein